jgi:hypothetical protein
MGVLSAVYYIMLWSSRYRYPVNWTLMFTAGVALKPSL